MPVPEMARSGRRKVTGAADDSLTTPWGRAELMGRREYTMILRCVDGCTNTKLAVATTREEAAQDRVRYAENPWRCSRHQRPDEVMSTDNRVREGFLTVEASRFGTPCWSDGSGGAHGPGFRAFPGDFPPGTRLVVTARIELPENGES